MDLVRAFEEEQITNIERPQLQTGDIVRVEMKVTEGEKERLQTFEGTILGLRGSGPSTTFTVRREVGRFAVERIFPLYNPLITNIEIVKRQKVRRSKLNYLREAGRRRVKEDEKAMQRHRKEEEDKKRLAEAAKQKAEEEKRKAEALQQAQDKKAEAEAQAKAEAEKAEKEKAKEAPVAEETKPEEKPAEETTEEPKAEDKE